MNPGETGVQSESPGVSAPAAQSPFMAEYLTAEQQSVIENASDVLIARCMAAAGFMYEGSDHTTVSSPITRDYDPTWGPLAPESAASNGYNNPYIPTLGPDGQWTTPQSHDGPWEQTDADRGYLDALIGSGDSPLAGGCTGAASEQLGRSGPQWLSAVNAVTDLQYQADSAAQNDPRLGEVVRAWSDCMAGEGYAYSTPQAAMSDAWGRSLDPREQATAYADAQCKEEVGLMQALQDLQFEYERDAIAKNRPIVDRFHELGLAALEKAEAVLAQQAHG